MLETFSEPPEANEGREVGPHQQGSKEGSGLRDQEAGGLVGHGQGTGRERHSAQRRAGTHIAVEIIN